ncbi:hypothetical protein E2C01_026303 [Portunus trituberculatus]|uniref:Uncharacterized protein n=1 Tax=Portunus trituberculatus TaxID=210409 RepID=A0A5B7EHT7_PORTR|nr:hypothetical protein [Portunus trituberculatus]
MCGGSALWRWHSGSNGSNNQDRRNEEKENHNKIHGEQKNIRKCKER